MNTHDITASYIKCNADAVGCKVFEISDKRFRTTVRVLAASLDDARAEINAQLWALRAMRSPLLKPTLEIEVKAGCRAEVKP